MNEQQPFEAIKNRDEAGREYWSARNLGSLLDFRVEKFSKGYF